MPLRAIADKLVRARAFQIDGQRDAVADVGLARDNALLLLQAPQFGVRERRRPAPQPQLIKPRSFAHQNRKRARTNLRVKRPFIAGLDAIELLRPVGDQPREHVEPPGRTFGIGDARHAIGQRHALQQRHDIDAARLEHRALRQIDLMQRQLIDALFDRRVRPRQKARADAPRDRAQAANPNSPAGSARLRYPSAPASARAGSCRANGSPAECRSNARARCPPRRRVVVNKVEF